MLRLSWANCPAGAIPSFRIADFISYGEPTYYGVKLELSQANDEASDDVHHSQTKSGTG
jgi:hypothetical protein